MTSPFHAAPPDAVVQVAGFCGNCGAPRTIGAQFCHRCGTSFPNSGPPQLAVPQPDVPQRATPPTAMQQPSVPQPGVPQPGVPQLGVPQPTVQHPVVPPTGRASIAAYVPWGIAGVALLAGVVYYASTNGGGAGGSAVDWSAAAPPAAASSGGMPNITAMSPSERAARLYGRIMAYAAAGKTDSVNFFAPMALAAHEMLAPPSNAERFRYGRIAEITNQPAIAKAQADTLLAQSPGNLLGLLLGARAARMIKDVPTERTYDLLLLKVVDRELATKSADYEQHRADIDRAVSEARSNK